MRNHYSIEYFQERDLLIIHLAETIKLFAKKHKLKKILDVGCGTGLYVKYLNNQGFYTKGCDNSPVALKKAWQYNSKKSVFKATATTLPFQKKSFDLVMAISLIEHLTAGQVSLFLKEARRVLKPKGYIFLVTPNFSSPLRIIQRKSWFGYSDPTHINFYTVSQLRKLLKDYGFKNPKWWFKTIYNPKQILIYLLFSTPLAILRNSFWILAQKDD